MTQRNQYRIENASSPTPEIYLYGRIGDSWFDEGISAANVVKDLNALGKKKDIIVRIDSGGGNVFEGTNIYNALVRNTAKITVHIDALAASIASAIAMAGEEIHMADNALMMIHEPAGSCAGTAADMRKMADTIDKARENLVGIYARRTGNKDSKISDWMRDETWFTATEALQAGMVTDITPGQKLAALSTRGMTDEDLKRLYGYHRVPSWLGRECAKPKLEAFRAKHGRMFRLAQEVK